MAHSRIKKDPRKQKQVPSGEPEKTAKKDKAIDAAVKDPTVQKFMKTFKAQILSVEQIKGKKK